MRASSCLLSWTWPPVRMKRSGLPSASTTALILVLGPPRERPIASSSVPLFCARCMLVCTDDSGIDDEVLVVRIFTQLVEDMLPNAVLRPSSETLELTVPVPELVRKIAPGRSRSENPEHTIDEAAIVLAVPSLVALFAWTQLLDALPLRIRQIAPNQARLPPVASFDHNCESEGIPRSCGRLTQVDRRMSTGPSAINVSSGSLGQTFRWPEGTCRMPGHALLDKPRALPERTPYEA